MINGAELARQHVEAGKAESFLLRFNQSQNDASLFLVCLAHTCEIKRRMEHLACTSGGRIEKKDVSKVTAAASSPANQNFRSADRAHSRIQSSGEGLNDFLSPGFFGF